MSTTWRKRIIWGGIGLAVVLLLVYGFWPEAMTVQVAEVQSGALEVTIEEQGETQLRNRYVVSAPVAAYLRRVDHEPGDTVAEGQVLARLEPPRSTPLDPRTRAEARARVQAAEAQLERAREEVQAARSRADYAEAQRQRLERLREQGSATEQMLDQATTEAQQARAARQAAEAAVTAARYEVQAAEAMLAYATGEDGADSDVIVLRAPVAGRVLAVHRESAGLVQAGQPLLDVGDPSALEVRVDVLSTDAVRIPEGTPVRLERWGGAETLDGVVRRVEPVAFTEVSSLGVEQQRVPVIVDLTAPPADRPALGAGYRVVASFVVWSGTDVLQVPASALFRTADGWATFVVDGGRAQQRSVEVGHRTGLTAQVLDGLAAGDRVITHPSSDLTDGARVTTE
ncbi:MAG: efflux RND transporter periplasmic adaptor subunit [Bacteroidetes bacterium]|jgi:HlyD family secretion protein|nr:efflux RND transporter periplasmic adaptor subunit [Bacteroidota bacterium]